MTSHFPTPDRSPTVQVNIKNLIDDVQCYQTVRELGVFCIYLLYVSTSLLWWQAVAAIIGVKSSTALRRNSRRTWRHRESSWNVHNTAIRHARSPLHLCGSVTVGVQLPQRRGTDQAPHRKQGHPRGAHGRSNAPSASQCHGRRCPPVSPLFASWEWLLHTGGS